MKPETSEPLDPFKAAQIADEASLATKGILLGLFGMPAVAWLWESVASLARDLDAGRADPGLIISEARDFFSILYAMVGLWGHAVLGTSGLHVAFGVLVAGVASIGVWGWAKKRRLARQYGARTVRDASRTALLQENPRLAERYEAEMQRREMRGIRRRGTTGGLRLLGWFVLLLPLVSIVTTITLAVKALWP